MSGQHARGCERTQPEREACCPGFEEARRGKERLSDTESRIALARGYFNDIATHFNTRLEIIPDRFVAGLMQMKPRALLSAEGFERQNVGVSFVE